MDYKITMIIHLNSIEMKQLDSQETNIQLNHCYICNIINYLRYYVTESKV
jgi:hypothetical protein